MRCADLYRGHTTVPHHTFLPRPVSMARLDKQYSLSADEGGIARIHCQNSTAALYEQDPFLVSLRGTPFWICAGISTMFYGYWSSKFRAIRKPLAFGFALYTAGLGEYYKHSDLHPVGRTR
jgi:hypothetical protein